MPIWMLLACAGAPEPRADTVVEAGFEPPALFVNEWMTRNDTVLADASGAHDDWLEIHNASDAPVSLAGLYLNDYPSCVAVPAPGRGRGLELEGRCQPGATNNGGAR